VPIATGLRGQPSFIIAYPRPIASRIARLLQRTTLPLPLIADHKIDPSAVLMRLMGTPGVGV
jgi:hypothetical protein